MDTPEEQAEHRKLWVKALRSGKYSQTRGSLQDADGFCCLGVACDVSGLGEWERDGDFLYVINGDVDDTVLPPPVASWLGLASTGGLIANRASLWALNDDGKPFPEIADIIESEPPGLLK